jgi:phosphoglycolate phosphatase-like HAD superfamily hydrolase
MLRANRSAGDPIMVGDQLDRDIIMAQSAGFRGVYFPGSFEPEWVRTVQATPDYVISSFSEILEIVH